MAVKLDEYANEPLVVIKPEAYLKMLKHVLSYGNEFADSSVEVMGICYGKEEGNQIVQHDAVPISHGGAIEVEFSTEDYAAFAMADEQMAEKGYYAIGWYHSHPGLKAFFSKVDVKNHLFYQKDQTKYAYGIVFDHMYFTEGDESLKYGFKAFRLNDYKKGLSSDFHDIKYKVELPDDLSYYREIITIIENAQARKPIIPEARESMDGLGVWEEEVSSDEEEAAPEQKDTFTDIRAGYQEGMQGLTSNFMMPMMAEFQEFTKDTQNAAQKGPQVMIQALEQMRDAISAGLDRVKGYFEKSLEKEIQEVSSSIEKTIREYSKNQQEIPQKVQGTVDKISEGLATIIGEQLEKSLEGVMGNIKKVSFSVQKISSLQESVQNAIDKQETTLKAFPEMLQKNSSDLNNNIGNLPKSINGIIGKRTDSMKAAFEDIKKTTHELKGAIDDLSKVIMTKRK
jgi:proteasome lid subunit RPN8/RPN11